MPRTSYSSKAEVASSVRMGLAGPAAEVFAGVPGQLLPLFHVVVVVRIASNLHRIVPFLARIGRGATFVLSCGFGARP